MTTAGSQRKAIRAARLYLEMRGFKLIEQGWGSGRHKIDIIAAKNNQVHFIEVNYQGDNSLRPIELMTQSRHSKMRAAAEAWQTDTKYNGVGVLSSIDMVGPNFAVIGFSENL
jgi:Holliday junction resolvase-like predicted endonuclease